MNTDKRIDANIELLQPLYEAKIMYIVYNVYFCQVKC